jgi:hypothetical protein
MINGAKLTVYIIIDPKMVEEMEQKGYTDKDIERAIKQSLTLKDKSDRQPVYDIESVFLEKYY